MKAQVVRSDGSWQCEYCQAWVSKDEPHQLHRVERLIRETEKLGLYDVKEFDIDSVD